MTLGRVGMYGGKFLPIPHMGHLMCMIRASTMVDELHVIISYDEEYEAKLFAEGGKLTPVSPTMRLRWWTQITKDMPHVHVHAVYEKQTGQLSDWDAGAKAIKEVVGKPIDVVFSSEFSYDHIFKRLYPGARHIVIDNERSMYPISGTALRTEGVMKHWNMIPETVKPYFVKKVVVVGTESCGKSTLVRNLANLYNTTYVEEWGRTFYERLGDCGDVTLIEDYPKIAFEHKYHEDVQAKRANKVMFIDTEALVTQYYAMLYLNKRLPVLDEIVKMQHYDLWLFLEPDVKWVDDGMRLHGEQDVREKNNEFLKNLLKEFEIPYVTISGNYQERLHAAMEEIDKLIV